MVPKYSFGVKVGGDPKSTSLSVPRHLQSAPPSKPGPGDYEALSSIKKNNREASSKQNCTWSVVPHGFVDLAKKNPGPGAYDHENLDRKNINKRNPKHQKPESTFAMDGVSGKTNDEVSRNMNPGPGQYNHTGSFNADRLKSQTNKPMLGGKIGASTDYSNGVPGPGTYEPDPKFPIPSFKIMQNVGKNDLAADAQLKVGPGAYDPKPNYEFSKNMTGIRLDCSGRAEKKNDPKHPTPGPNVYYITGDFDFRDPNKPEVRVGKLPKFAFGMKHNTKPKNLDCPGPGEYETDQYPMN